MTRRVLDLFCGAGGAGYGYHLAGFDVVGVDISPQPSYPFEFHQADAMTWPLDGFDLIHASPPCQSYSATAVLTTREYPRLIAPVRERMKAAGVPYVIENVRKAGRYLELPAELCGCMFEELRGLLYEPRLFEASFAIRQPAHWPHSWPTTKMGRPPVPGECMQMTGHFHSPAEGARRMGVAWMRNRGEIAEAIPPAYTRLVGLAAVEGAAALVQASLF